MRASVAQQPRAYLTILIFCGEARPRSFRVNFAVPRRDKQEFDEIR